MNKNIETKEISISINDGTMIQVNGRKTLIKDLLSMTEEGILLKNVELPNKGEEIDIWANLSIGNANLTNYEERTKVIKNIASIARKNNIKGINIVLSDNNKDSERFIIELAPRLNEIGIITNIIKNTDIQKDMYENIVSYIITN